MHGITSFEVLSVISQIRNPKSDKRSKKSKFYQKEATQVFAE